MISSAYAAHAPAPDSKIWRRGKTWWTWELAIPSPLVHQGSGDMTTPRPWSRAVQTSSARKCTLGSTSRAIGMLCRRLLLDRSQAAAGTASHSSLTTHLAQGLGTKVESLCPPPVVHILDSCPQENWAVLMQEHAAPGAWEAKRCKFKPLRLKRKWPQTDILLLDQVLLLDCHPVGRCHCHQLYF